MNNLYQNIDTFAITAGDWAVANSETFLFRSGHCLVLNRIVLNRIQKENNN